MRGYKHATPIGVYHLLIFVRHKASLSGRTKIKQERSEITLYTGSIWHSAITVKRLCSGRGLHTLRRKVHTPSRRLLVFGVLSHK